MYINLNSFMPFFISLKENPKFPFDGRRGTGTEIIL